jgi:hypothetical protein
MDRLRSLIEFSSKRVQTSANNLNTGIYMSLLIYGNPTVYSSANGTNLAWIAQSHELSKDSIINYSVRGNQLHERIDGSLEIIPKTPAQVIGERIIRPLIDTTCDLSSRTFQSLKRSFSFLDNALTRTLNFLPVARAENTPPTQTTLAKCLGKHLEQTYQVTIAGTENGDSKMLEAAHTLYGPFFEQCFNEETYHKAKEQYKKNLAIHNLKNNQCENKLKECKDKNSGSCYSQKEEVSPDIFQIDGIRIDHKNGNTVAAREWTTSQGSLFCSIYVQNTLWLDTYYDNVNYNYDQIKGQTTIDNRKSIESRHRKSDL